MSINEDPTRIYFCTDCAVKMLRLVLVKEGKIEPGLVFNFFHIYVEPNCKNICESCKTKTATGYIGCKPSDPKVETKTI